MKSDIKKYKISSILFFVLIVIIYISVFFFLNTYGEEMKKKEYARAIELYKAGENEAAKKIFEELSGYENSNQYIKNIEFLTTVNDIKNIYFEMQNENDEYEAILSQYDNLLNTINDLSETEVAIEEETEAEVLELKKSIIYSYAECLFTNKEYESAMQLFQEIKNYKKSSYYLAQITLLMYPDAQQSLYENARNEFLEGNYETALSIFEELEDYEDSKTYIEKCERLMHANPVSAGIRASFFINNNLQIESRGDIAQSLMKISNYENPIAISAMGNILMVLGNAGNVYVYGEITESNKKYLESIDNIVQIATGQQYAVELTSDGKVYAVGHNGDGQCDAETKWKDYIVKEIDCGWRTTVGLDKDGRILIIGYRSELYEELIQKEGWTDVIHIATGGGGHGADGKGHVVGLKKDKTVVAVGDNTFGQCDTKDWKEVVAIAAGDFHTVGLREDGTVYITTDEGNKELAFAERIVRVSAGTGYSIFVGESGRVYTEDVPYTHQGQVDGIEQWRVYVGD